MTNANGIVRRLSPLEAAAYLTERLGRKVEPKTLANWRSSGKRGPKCEYFGPRPVYRSDELDRWIEQEAFSARPTGKLGRPRRLPAAG